MIKTSLFADQEREAKLNKLGDALRLLEQHVDFSALAAEVDRAAPRPSRERGGRPPFPTELLVRVLLIQQLFNLSDEQMEFQLLDGSSFLRFAGLVSSKSADLPSWKANVDSELYLNSATPIDGPPEMHGDLADYISRPGRKEWSYVYDLDRNFPDGKWLECVYGTHSEVTLSK
ncbi:MAG TPA: STY0301 family protein, partial [Burkholderiaceae bacterium]|nr:STY0301 family protein [Burkholderiaceae bacterium]